MNKKMDKVKEKDSSKLLEHTCTSQVQKTVSMD